MSTDTNIEEIEKIIFEQPLNERCRLLLRISHLFEKYDYHIQKKNLWDSRAALGTLLDITKILIRSDIKIDLLKEIERYTSFLSRMVNFPDIDHEKLSDTLDILKKCQSSLINIEGPLGSNLRKDELLNNFLQRKDIPGGDFDFDLPLLHLWLNKTHDDRLIQFNYWRKEIEPVYSSVSILLDLIRNSTKREKCEALNGFYQQNLPNGSSIQMVQLYLEKKYENIYAEISGGKHRLSIRFMQYR